MHDVTPRVVPSAVKDNDGGGGTTPSGGNSGTTTPGGDSGTTTPGSGDGLE